MCVYRGCFGCICEGIFPSPVTHPRHTRDDTRDIPVECPGMSPYYLQLQWGPCFRDGPPESILTLVYAVRSSIRARLFGMVG